MIVGSGPNGLTAAAVLARAGKKVLVLEAAPVAGGGLRSAELTEPGFLHDVCSAVHPMGALSPAFRELGLEDHGLTWCRSEVSYAHPLDDRPAGIVGRDLDETAARLGIDGDAWRALIGPFLADPDPLIRGILSPPAIPEAPFQMARFGLRGLGSARNLADSWFREETARALLAGCAAHSLMPLDQWFTGAFGLVFLISAHLTNWPVARGGSQAIAAALIRVIEAHGGSVETGREVRALADVPDTHRIFFDLDPRQVAGITGDALPASYRSRLLRFDYGVGAFKIDYALDGPIPWTDPAVGRASTVHLGGTLEEIAAGEAAIWRGEHAMTPFVLVCQQSVLDPTRAPEGKHTGYAYIHVPAGSDVDQTEVIEAQLERFAPGFKDLVRARFTRHAAGFEAYNPTYVGGAITGGPALPTQLLTRPVVRWSPYTTPNPKIFLCSQHTPPGGGVHGMCGWHAAQAALARW